jgi:hypothetical protein
MVQIGSNSVATKEAMREIDEKIATDTAKIEKIMKELNERGIH